MLGAMNPMNLMPFGSEKEEKDADDQKAGQFHLRLSHESRRKPGSRSQNAETAELHREGNDVRLTKSHSCQLCECTPGNQEICNMNCKMAGLMGAAAGGAAGHVVEKKLKEKSEVQRRGNLSVTGRDILRACFGRRRKLQRTKQKRHLLPHLQLQRKVVGKAGASGAYCQSQRGVSPGPFGIMHMSVHNSQDTVVAAMAATSKLC